MDVLLARFNQFGGLQWAYAYGGSPTNGNDCGESVIESGGDLFVTGATDSSGAGTTDVLLTKFTASGIPIWARTLGGPDEDHGYSLVVPSMGGLVVTGNTRSFGSGGEDLLLTHFDFNGDYSWGSTLGGTNNEGGFSVIDADMAWHRLVVIGYTYSWGTGPEDVLFATFDYQGNAACSQPIIEPVIRNASLALYGNLTRTLDFNWTKFVKPDIQPIMPITTDVCVPTLPIFIAHFMTPEREPYPFDIIISNGTWRKEWKNVTYIKTEVPTDATYTLICDYYGVNGTYRMHSRFNLTLPPGVSTFKFYAINPEQITPRKPFIAFEQEGANPSLSWHWDPVNNILAWNVTKNFGLVGVSLLMDEAPPAELKGWATIKREPGPCDKCWWWELHPTFSRVHYSCHDYIPAKELHYSTTTRFGLIPPLLGTIRIGYALHNDSIIAYPLVTTLKNLNGTEEGIQRFLDPDYGAMEGHYILSITGLPIGYINHIVLPVVIKVDRHVYLDLLPPKPPPEPDPGNFVYGFKIIAQRPLSDCSWSNITHTNKSLTVSVSTNIDYDYWGAFILPRDRMVKWLTAYSKGVAYNLSKFYNYTETQVGNYTIVAVRIPPEMDGICLAYTVFGDITADGKVDIRDIALAARAFGSDPTHPRWDPTADINYDFTVNIIDIAAIARQFGKTDC